MCGIISGPMIGWELMGGVLRFCACWRDLGLSGNGIQGFLGDASSFRALKLNGLSGFAIFFKNAAFSP